MRVLTAVAAVVITGAIFIAVPVAFLKMNDELWRSHPVKVAGSGTAVALVLFVPVVVRARRLREQEAAAAAARVAENPPPLSPREV